MNDLVNITEIIRRIRDLFTKLQLNRCFHMLLRLRTSCANSQINKRKLGKMKILTQFSIDIYTDLQCANETSNCILTIIRIAKHFLWMNHHERSLRLLQ
jgi:hypothetical protein